ncbi:MAG: hypothetical protein H0V44_06585 [Planctomycetes bacterium]|nr:hypothetical protein [Planctomycetota bacterium]
MPRCLVSVVLIALLTTLGAPAADVVLRAPLTTVVPITGTVSEGDKDIVASVTIPPDAPSDLGVAAWVTDRHGRWYQTARPGTLTPGAHELRFSLAEGDAVQPQNHAGHWNPAESAKTVRGGILFWSASGSRAGIKVEGLRAIRAIPKESTAPRLCDLRLDTPRADGGIDAATGSRWSLSARPQPFPKNPYDRGEFSLDLVVSTPDGHEQRIPGFFIQPMRGSDRGDREELLPDGAAAFSVRYRPRTPGIHRLRLEGRWAKRGASTERTLAITLPPLTASGAAWDDYARVDAKDPRFFSADGSLVWPIGPNLRSVWDLRSKQYLDTRVTPDRGTLAYHAYLARLAANGVNAIEVWMCSWNLALEWRGDWPGYFGQGRFSEENAWRLDRILDDAWAHGIRVNLVVNNHGQGSDRTDKEWNNNPYNQELGGKLTAPLQLFTDPRALEGQERLRTYMVARYADHPAILGWKLWSEINLTAGSQDQEALRSWHEKAAARWHELDVYDHGCTTHWAGDFRAVSQPIAVLPGIDYLCIDAYHGPAAEGGGMILADLLARSTGEGRANGLSRYNKPVLVTEYGGNWSACPPPQLIAENSCGGWAALVTGHAGAPMLWWFEWLDQGDRFGPYQAIARFIAGEDLRHPQARAVALTATSPAGDLWSRAWMRPGRMLGYVMDRQWGTSGMNAAVHERAALATIAQIAAGRIVIEWWNADDGTALPPVSVDHPGGTLTLQPPPFTRHIAFKMYRTQDG